MTTSDLIATIALIVSALFGAITSYYAIKAKILSEKVNDAQGVFKSPALRVQVFDDDNIGEFFLAVPLANERFVEVPLLLDIGNAGEKSALEVELLIRLSKDLCYGGKLPLKLSSPFAKVNGQLFSVTDSLASYIVSAQSLNPKQALSLPLKLSLSHDTSVESSVDVSLKDGSTATLPYSIDYAYKLDLIVTQRDQLPLSRSYDLHVLNTSDKTTADVLREYNERIASGLSPISLLHRVAGLLGLWEPPSTGICVVEYRAEDIVPDETVPINYFKPDSVVSLHKGVRMKNGLMFSGLQVYPPSCPPGHPH